MTNEEGRRIERILATLESETAHLRSDMEQGQLRSQSQVAELFTSLSGQISQVDAKISDTRRILDLHLTGDEKWMDEHTTRHAYSEGIAQGKDLASKGMIAIFGMFLAIVTFIANLLSPLVQEAIK